MSEVEPDIVVVAKGLSNGFPLSAVVAKESLFDQYMERNKFVFFTYGANPMGCVAASETLSVICVGLPSNRPGNAPSHRT